MKTQKTRYTRIQHYCFILFIIIIILLIFSLIDYLIHLLSGEYSVPSYYFRNKILFGTIIGFITYLFVRKTSIITQSLIVSATVSVLLQLRYYLEGYPKDFVFLFLGIHFLILIGVTLTVFTAVKKFSFDKYTQQLL